MPKVYYVKSIHKGRERIYEGTIEYLVKNVFGYTLSCGKSWNDKINDEPKTLRALVSNLNKASEATNAYYDSYYESSPEEFATCESRSFMSN